MRDVAAECLTQRCCVIRENLCILSAARDGLMLPPVAYQQNTIIRMETIHKVMHLPSGRQRRFVKNVQALFTRVGFLAAREMLLERRSFHPCLGKFLRGPGCGRKTFDMVSLGHCRFADNGQSCGFARTSNRCSEAALREASRTG